MPDAPPPPDAGPTDRGRHPTPGYLTPERVDQTLADFRTYLEALLDPPPAPDALPEPFDLSALVAQFTALRHDVNLQTKAVRAVAEQAPAPTPKPAAPPDNAAPLVKALIDIADALLASHRQMVGVRAGLEPLLAALTTPPTPPADKPGFFARLFGKPAPAAADPPDAAAAKLVPLIAGVADGYALSLRRVEKALEAAGLEVIAAVGRAFDPERMEAVELAGGGPSGSVVEEVRRGYTKGGSVVRFALVKVAR